MKKCVLLLGALFLMLSGCGPKGNSGLIPADQRVQAAEIKADFLNSSPMTLEKLKGKVVVLDFWATWCGPCRMEIPSLIKTYDAYHDKGLEILGLSVEANDSQPKDFFNQFISNNKINYSVGLASRETSKSYGIDAIPATFFVDKSGKIALAFVGVHPEEEFANAVEALLRE